MRSPLRRTAALLAAGIAVGAALTACTAADAGTDSGAERDDVWRTASSAEDGGGMDALVEAAKAEGALNVMGLYPDWANYGGLVEAFTEKYGIEVDNDTSAGSSQDQINAVVNRAGQDESLDYLDTGLSFAADAHAQGLLASYAPETAADIPESLRGEDDAWQHAYGGTIAIGCDTTRIEECPVSFADLRDEKYKGKISMPGDPTQGESGFMSVYAAAFAQGGSAEDIHPGVELFGELAAIGNLVQAEPSVGTIETGETPIVVNWDYLLVQNAADLGARGIEFTVAIPSDGSVSSYYAASINADAPHPAAARLWIEFLFSDEGQNLLLDGFVSPARLAAMTEAGTVDEEARSALPEGTGEAEVPSLEERTAAQAVLLDEWAEAVSR